MIISCSAFSVSFLFLFVCVDQLNLHDWYRDCCSCTSLLPFFLCPVASPTVTLPSCSNPPLLLPSRCPISFSPHQKTEGNWYTLTSTSSKSGLLYTVREERGRRKSIYPGVPSSVRPRHALSKLCVNHKENSVVCNGYDVQVT